MLADAGEIGPAGDPDRAGVRPGAARAHRHRQCPRRHSHGRPFSVLILLVFLKDIRATLIAALAIPLEPVVSFVFLY